MNCRCMQRVLPLHYAIGTWGSYDRGSKQTTLRRCLVLSSRIDKAFNESTLIQFLDKSVSSSSGLSIQHAPLEVPFEWIDVDEVWLQLQGCGWNLHLTRPQQGLCRHRECLSRKLSSGIVGTRLVWRATCPSNPYDHDDHRAALLVQLTPHSPLGIWCTARPRLHSPQV